MTDNHEAKRKRADRVRLRVEKGIFYAEEVRDCAADVLELLEEIQQLTSALETEGGNDE